MKKLTNDQKTQIVCSALRAVAAHMPEEAKRDPVNVAEQAIKLAVLTIAKTEAARVLV